MITQALIDFVCQAAGAVLGLLPTWAPPATPFGTAAVSIGGLAATANGYFPVAVLGVCLALVFALKVVLLAWRAVVFIYHQFWGSD